MAPIADTPLSGSDLNMEKSTGETGSPNLGIPQSPSQLEQQSDLIDLERLGRERPPCFSNIWSELTFGFSIVMSQILAV
ncbi:unnamed protein product [Aspergillus oryzae]|nr:unnamed protein product [Aspergillus oryzae]GMF84593.1 unnamed protein product [Aspergillus oryzae]GMG12941.1 unnamed protein product [Aspergillus oryzae]